MAGDARRVASDARGVPGDRRLTLTGTDKTGGRKQHVDAYRKLALRRTLIALLPEARDRRAAYVPFIGDGDIAAELYGEWHVLGVDVDRVAVARSRVTGRIIAADCDTWPFAGEAGPLSLGDFDAYSYPYDSFRAAWSAAIWTSPCVVIFTDGQRQSVKRTGVFRHPDGSKVDVPDISERRAIYNAYRSRTVEPWFHAFLAPDWRATTVQGYLRQDMLYWGALLERSPADGQATTTPEVVLGADAAPTAVDDALFQAAISGNVAAIAMWYEQHPKTATLVDLARQVGLEPD